MYRYKTKLPEVLFETNMNLVIKGVYQFLPRVTLKLKIPPFLICSKCLVLSSFQVPNTPMLVEHFISARKGLKTESFDVGVPLKYLIVLIDPITVSLYLTDQVAVFPVYYKGYILDVLYCRIPIFHRLLLFYPRPYRF